MSERCPTCNSPVRVVSSDSERVATCHYQPVASVTISRAEYDKLREWEQAGQLLVTTVGATLGLPGKTPLADRQRAIDTMLALAGKERPKVGVK
jgi:hypothetical protein